VSKTSCDRSPTASQAGLLSLREILAQKENKIRHFLLHGAAFSRNQSGTIQQSGAIQPARASGRQHKAWSE